MSKEREVIHAMIEERETKVRAKHRHMDELYDWYDFEAWKRGGAQTHDEITKLYDEILLLKMILIAADIT